MPHLTALQQASAEPFSITSGARRKEGSLVGSVIDGRYRLLREIARGGGGVVFEGEHLYTGARVAVKTLNHAASTRVGRGRLRCEARALGLARHPHVVPVLDAGECPRHGLFLVLALIEGRTLESFVTGRARLEAVDTVALIAQLGNALSALARRGVVHRDLKPSNVLVKPGGCGEPDTALLIDFGIARLPPELAPPGPRLTLDGALVGTPGYMAPEQLAGREVDARTDVYGLGALAYECLTGTTPFVGDMFGVASSVTDGARPAAIEHCRGDVSPALAAAVMRALQPAPDERWPDAASFVQACIATTFGSAPPLYLFARNLGHTDTIRPAAPSRRASRAPYQAPARVLLPTGDGHDGRVEDISSGGLLLATAAGVAASATVVVKFPLPMSGHVVALDAVVKWTRPRQSTRLMGLEFTRIPAEVQREIAAFSAPLD